jgi:hypothetical protein
MQNTYGEHFSSLMTKHAKLHVLLVGLDFTNTIKKVLVAVISVPTEIQLSQCADSLVVVEISNVNV